jgi:hypothetical protein
MVAAAIVGELSAYVEAAGLQALSIQPIAAGIEDSFMWYMAQERAG